MKNNILAAVAAACIIASGSAGAVTTGSMTNIRIENFSPDGSPVVSSPISLRFNLATVVNRDVWTQDFGPRANVKAAVDSNNYATVSSSSGLLSDTSLSAGTMPEGFFIQTRDAAESYWNFTLAPGMEIVFSADVAFSTNKPGFTENSEAALGLTVTDPLTNIQQTSFSIQPFAGSKLNNHISLAILNTGTMTETGIFDASVYVIESPVPEPSSAAMLLAGFGLLGFAFRRRRG